jgi:hypothetical protein
MHARGLDHPLFAQVTQVARAWIGGAAIVVAEIATGHAERANGRERSRFGAAQGVLAITVMNQFALWSTWQVNIAAECIRDLAIAFSIVAVAVGPARIVIAATSFRV